MAFIKSGVAMTGLLAVGIGYAVSGAPRTAPAGPDAANSFHVLLEGADTGCEVTMGEGPAAKARLVFGKRCAAAFPELAGALFWDARDDGSIAFTGASGEVAMLFSAGDGVDYEAFGAGTRLISLVSAGDPSF
jgi:hypothetical protein